LAIAAEVEIVSALDSRSGGPDPEQKFVGVGENGVVVICSGAFLFALTIGVVTPSYDSTGEKPTM